MTDNKDRQTSPPETKAIPLSKEQLALLPKPRAGSRAFEYDLDSKKWDWEPQVASLFGLDPDERA